jgi:WD40 repeat protein/serine/threonine protein kinase
MSEREKDVQIGRLEARIRELEGQLARTPPRADVELLSIAGLEQKVLQLNKDLEVEYVNSALARALRVDREKLKGAPLREIDRFPWGPGYLEVLIDLARAKREPVSKDQAYYDQSLGREVYVRITVTPRETGPQVVIEDRTELRALEQSFRRYVSPQVLDQMKTSGKDFFLPERRSITVLFADLRGFTSMSEKMSPETVRQTVNAFLDRMIGVLQQNDATVDKIVGDEVMALFGAPLPCEDHPLRAIRAAVEMQRAHARLMEEARAEGRPMPPMGIGVNTGEMVVGNIGSEFRTDYTVIGHNVNVAARLCGAAQGGEILISQATFDAAVAHSRELKDQAIFNPQRPIEVKGVSRPVDVVSVLPKEGEEVQVRRLREADRRRLAPSGRRFFGHYEILEEIGRGGMSVVYKAAHKDLGRIVALKMLIAGEGASEKLIKRFQREAEATARLRHPNVIPIHEVGIAEGHHYFTMDLVEGITLADLIREFGAPSGSKGTSLEEAIRTITRRKTTSEIRELAQGREAGGAEPAPAAQGRPLPVNQAVRLMRDVTRGIQHAHENGIIHRDVKPSNVMITRDGRPVVLDFGLARGIEEGEDLTKSGTLVGTIPYMSPEQAEGSVSNLDERSDIYSLGAVLYEMLTGRRAFEPTGNDAADARRLVTEEAPRPCAVNPRVPRELETILLKAMEKDRDRRYPSAGALADDLERYLAGEPILARPPSALYRIRKKLARHRALAAVSALAVLALVSLTGLYLVNVTRARFEAERSAETAQVEADRARAAEAEAKRQEAQAVRARAAAERIAKVARDEADRARVEATRARKAEDQARQQEAEIKRRLAEGLVLQGNALGLTGRWQDAKERYGEAWGKLKELGMDSLPAELGLLAAYRHSPPALVSIPAEQTTVTRSAALSPDGSFALSASKRGAILWDLKTGREVRSFTEHQGLVNCVALSSDGKKALSGGLDTLVKLWDLETGRELETFRGHAAFIQVVALSRNGAWAASADANRTLKVWDLQGRKEYRTFTGHGEEINDIAFSPDGRWLASGGKDSTLRLWDLKGEGGPPRVIPLADWVNGIAFTPDGSHILAGHSFYVSLLERASDKEARTLWGHRGYVAGVDVSQDSRWALTGSWDFTMKLWDFEKKQLIQTFTGHSDAVRTVLFSRDAKLALSAGYDQTLKLWNLGPEGRDGGHFRTNGWHLECAAFSPDGRLLVTGAADGSLRVWDVSTRRLLRSFGGRGFAVLGVAVSPDGLQVASGNGDGAVLLWDLETGRERRSFTGHAGPVWSVAFSRDGTQALSGGADKTMRLWDVASGREIRRYEGHTDGLRSVDFSPDGRLALSAGFDFGVKLWDLRGSVAVRSLLAHRGHVNRAVFLPDNRHAISAGEDGPLILWDLASGTAVRRFLGHAGIVESIACSPDGRLAVSGGFDQAVKLWEIATGQEVASFGGLDAKVKAVALSPDGRWAFAGDYHDGALLLDLTRPARYREFEARLEKAYATLKDRPEDAASLAALGEWFSFRGVWSWAADLLARARAGGAPISTVELARCLWQAGDLPAARREFQRAAEGQEVPRIYANLCVEATRVLPAQPAGGQPFHPGLLAECYAGVDANQLQARRVDPRIAFDWGTGPAWPRGPAGPFSIRWTGALRVPKSANYVFSAHARGGIRLRVDDLRLIDAAPSDSSVHESLPIGLERGTHQIVVEYVKVAESASLALFWKEVEERTPRPIGPQVLFHRPVAAEGFTTLVLQEGDQPSLGITPGDGGAPPTGGVLVRDVAHDGPAMRGKIRPGDVVTHLEGKKVTTFDQLRQELRRYSTGHRVDVLFLHEGTSYTTTCTLRPEEEVDQRDRQYQQQAALGVVFDTELDAQTEGAPVKEVVPGGAAEAAGLRAGDVLTHVDGKKVLNYGDVRPLVEARKAGQTIELGFSRHGENRTVACTLKSRAETFRRDAAPPKAPQPPK